MAMSGDLETMSSAQESSIVLWGLHPPRGTHCFLCSHSGKAFLFHQGRLAGQRPSACWSAIAPTSGVVSPTNSFKQALTLPAGQGDRPH